MLKKIFSSSIRLITILAIVGLMACYSISLFDHYAYTQATGLKVDSLKLMAKAIEDFSRHEAEVDDLLTRIEKAYEYEKARPDEKPGEEPPSAEEKILLARINQVRDQIQKLQLPIGWTKMSGDPRGGPRTFPSWLAKIFGILFTTIAVSLGAPLLV